MKRKLGLKLVLTDPKSPTKIVEANQRDQELSHNVGLAPGPHKHAKSASEEVAILHDIGGQCWEGASHQEDFYKWGYTQFVVEAERRNAVFLSHDRQRIKQKRKL